MGAVVKSGSAKKKTKSTDAERSEQGQIGENCGLKQSVRKATK